MEDVEGKIHEVAGKHFEQPVEDLEELSGGASHYTYRVSFPNGEEYVFKLSNYDWSDLPDYEHGFSIDGPVLTFLADKEFLPTPEAFIFDNSEKGFDFKYLISEKVQGENMYLSWDSVDLSVVEEAGRKLALLHERTEFDDHGKIGYRQSEEDLFVEKTESWPEMYSNIFHSLVDNLEDTKFSEFRSEIRELFEDNREVLRDNPPAALVHQEFSPRNIMVKEGKVEGVLDWERSISGDPEYDLFTAERHFTVKTNLFEGTSQTAEEIQEAFRKGYRDVRDLEQGWEERRIFYHLLYVVHMLWILDDEVDEDVLLEKYREIKDDLDGS